MEVLLDHLLTGGDASHLLELPLLEPSSCVLELFFQLCLELEKLFEGVEEVQADGVEVVLDELDNLSLASVGFLGVRSLLLHTVHGGLQGEAIGHLELVPDDNPRSVVLGLLLREFTHVEVKDWLQ